MIGLVVVLVVLLRLHGPAGQEIDVNPNEISSLREPQKGTEGHYFAHGTHCLVKMTNGNTNIVAEDCATVRTMVEELQRRSPKPQEKP